MTKAKAIVWLIVAEGMVYLMLAVFISWLAGITVSVNADLAAAHNMAQYPGTSDFLLASPWILYTIPAVLGIIVLIVILKRREDNV